MTELASYTCDTGRLTRFCCFSETAFVRVLRIFHCCSLNFSIWMCHLMPCRFACSGMEILHSLINHSFRRIRGEIDFHHYATDKHYNQLCKFAARESTWWKFMAILSRRAAHCVGVCHIAEAWSKAAGHSCGRPPLLSDTPAVARTWHLSGALAPKNARCVALAHSHTIAAARNKLRCQPA